MHDTHGHKNRSCKSGGTARQCIFFGNFHVRGSGSFLHGQPLPARGSRTESVPRAAAEAPSRAQHLQANPGNANRHGLLERTRGRLSFSLSGKKLPKDERGICDLLKCEKPNMEKRAFKLLRSATLNGTTTGYKIIGFFCHRKKSDDRYGGNQI